MKRNTGRTRIRVLDYMNSQGRDAVIRDTTVYDAKGNINVFLKVNEGRKYYFGDIAWRGIQNTPILSRKYTGYQKGDTIS